MSANSKLAKYPAAYTRILLALPADGSPLEFPLSSNESAKLERLRFYNFLKFLDRNPDCSAAFGNRHNEVRIAVKDSTIRFQLRVSHLSCELADSLDQALAHMTLPAVNQPATELHAAYGLHATAPAVPLVDPDADASNVLDTFLKGIGAK